MATGESVEGETLIAKAGRNGKTRKHKLNNNKNKNKNRSTPEGGAGADPRGGGGGGPTSKTKRAQYCTICKNHNQHVLKKKHNCPYSGCQCPLCQLSRRVQCIMCHQQRLWRFRKSMEKNSSYSSNDAPPTLNAVSSSPVFVSEGEFHQQESAVDDPLGGVTEATSAKERRKAEKSGKQQVCDKCRNHDVWVLKRGHKDKCRYESCDCQYCSFTIKRRDLMKHQQRVRRAQVTSQPTKGLQDYILQPAEASAKASSNCSSAEESVGSPSGMSPDMGNQEAESKAPLVPHTADNSQVKWASFSNEKADEGPRVSPKISYWPTRDSAQFQRQSGDSTVYQKASKEPHQIHQQNIDDLPLQQSSKESMSFQQQSGDPMTFHNQCIDSTPFQQQNRNTIPFQHPSRNSTTIEQPSKDSMPFQQQNRDSTTFQQPCRNPSPFQQGNRDSTSFQQPSSNPSPFQQGNRDSTSFQQPCRNPSPFQQGNRDTTPFHQPSKDSITYQPVNGDSLLFQQPNRDLMQQPNRDSSVFQQVVPVNHPSAYAPMVAETPIHSPLKRMKVEPNIDEMPYDSSEDLRTYRDFATPPQDLTHPRTYASGPGMHYVPPRSQLSPKFGVEPEDLLLRQWPTNDAKEMDNCITHSKNNFRGSSLCIPLPQVQPHLYSHVQLQPHHRPGETASLSSFEPESDSLVAGWRSSSINLPSLVAARYHHNGEVAQPHLNAMQQLTACEAFIPTTTTTTPEETHSQSQWWQHQIRVENLERTNSG